MSKSIEVDAKEFADAWLAVHIASSNAVDRPALYRSVLLEVFNTGIRLVATDSFVLFKTWVSPSGREPDLGELPVWSANVSDKHLRLSGLLRFLAKNQRWPETVTIEKTDAEVEFRTDREIVILEDVGAFPDYRQLDLFSLKPEPVDSIALGTKTLTKLARLTKGDVSTVNFTLTGKDKVVGFELGKSGISGAVMPVRVS